MQPSIHSKTVELSAFNAIVEAGDTRAVAAALDAQGELIHRPTTRDTPLGEHQWLPLHRAAHAGDPAMVRLLLDRGANPDARTRFHDPALARATALHLAAAGAHAQVVKLLLGRGAFADPLDAQNLTPLHLAVEAAAPAAASLLIAAGANVNHPCPDDHGAFTPLHRCVRRGAHCLPIAQELIQSGADLHAFDPDRGQTPLQWAQQAGPAGEPFVALFLGATGPAR